MLSRWFLERSCRKNLSNDKVAAQRKTLWRIAVNISPIRAGRFDTRRTKEERMERSGAGLVVVK